MMLIITMMTAVQKENLKKDTYVKESLQSALQSVGMKSNHFLKNAMTAIWQIKMGVLKHVWLKKSQRRQLIKYRALQKLLMQYKQAPWSHNLRELLTW